MSDNVEYNPKSPLVPNGICKICKKTFPMINGTLFNRAYVSFTAEGKVDRITGQNLHSHADDYQLLLPGFENV